MKQTIASVALLALVSSCSRTSTSSANDPMSALASSTPTTKYVHEFWLQQARQRTALWDSAYAYCSTQWRHDDGSKPNCGHVKTANFFNAGATAPVRPR